MELIAQLTSTTFRVLTESLFSLVFSDITLGAGVDYDGYLHHGNL